MKKKRPISMMRRFVALIFLLLIPFVSEAQRQGGEPDAESDSLEMRIGSLLRNPDSFNELYSEVNRITDADIQLHYAKMVYDAFQSSTDSVKLAQAYALYGDALIYHGDNHGLELSIKGLQIVEQLGIDSLLTSMLAHIGSHYANNWNTDCLIYYSRAEDIALRSNDYRHLEILYYDIAFFYVERCIFNMAIEYFEKSRDAAMHCDGVDDDYIVQYDIFIQIFKALECCQKGDTSNLCRLANVLGHYYPLLSSSSNDASMEDKANLTMGITDVNLMAAKRSQGRSREIHLRNAHLFLDLLMSYIEKYKVTWMIPQSYNQLYVRYLVATGNLEEAERILSDPESISLPVERNLAEMEFYEATQNYNKVLECMVRDAHHRYTSLSLDNAVDFENMPKANEYKQHLAMIEEEKLLRDAKYEKDYNYTNIILHHAILLLIIIIVVIGFFLYSHHSNNLLTAKLEETNREITKQNAQLEERRSQVLVQTQEISKQKNIITGQRNDLEHSNNLLTVSIDMAANIQRALVWDEQTVRSIVGDCFIIWKPLHKVSGDFYWVANIDGKQYVIVADCTGHGVPGALLSMYGIAMLNDYVRRNSDKNAAQILEVIKAAFLGSFVRGDKDFYDGMDCAIAIINYQSMTVDYSGAKRPLVKISNGNIYDYKPDKISIGNNPLRDHLKFTQQTVDIAKGDMIYLFSDGIADQFGDEDGTTRFGNRQLYDILSEVSYLDVTIQKTVIDSVVENWRSGPYYAGLSRREIPQLDDQLLLGIRI